MQSWLEGRNWVGKCAQVTGMTASVRILSSKADSNTWESFTRSELKLESVYQVSPNIFRKRATKPLLKQKHRQNYLTWAKDKNNWTVAQLSKSYILHFIWKSRSQSLDEEWRGTESMLLEVQCEVFTVSEYLGCPVICRCWSTVFSEVHSHGPQAATYQEILEHYMLHSVDKLYGDADFIFQQDLAPAHTAKGYKIWFNDHGLTGLDWPANSPDLNPIENLRGIVNQEEDERHQTQQCRWPEGCYQSNLGFHYTWAVPQADCLHATLHWCSNSCKRRPNHVLSA